MRGCWLKVFGVAGAAFLALAGEAENLEKYLFGPGALWILGGTFIVFCWGFEMFCIGDED